MKRNWLVLQERKFEMQVNPKFQMQIGNLIILLWFQSHVRIKTLARSTNLNSSFCLRAADGNSAVEKLSTSWFQKSRCYSTITSLRPFFKYVVPHMVFCLTSQLCQLWTTNHHRFKAATWPFAELTFRILFSAHQFACQWSRCCAVAYALLFWRMFSGG